MLEEEAKPVIVNGTLHCENCKCPLILVKKGEDDICRFCGRKVGKLSDEQMVQLARNLSDDWVIKHIQ